MKTVYVYVMVNINVKNRESKTRSNYGFCSFFLKYVLLSTKYLL